MKTQGVTLLVLAAALLVPARARAQDRATNIPVAVADQARIRGAETANVWLVIVGDLANPRDRAFQLDIWPALDSLYVRRGALRVAWVNLPSDANRNSGIAAEVAACAGLGSKFWPAHDAFLRGQEQWVTLPDPTRLLTQLAERRGGDSILIADCLKQGRVREFLRGDVARARGAGIRTAPGFIVGNVVMTKATRLDDFRRAIDAALATSR